MTMTWGLSDEVPTGQTGRERAIYAAWVRHANESGLDSGQALTGWQEVETKLAQGHSVEEAFTLAVRSVR